MSKFIIICGLPGSGKTTLARSLSKKLNTPCLHKDSIKENLYDILGAESLVDSQRIGLQSFKLLLNLTEEIIKNNIDLIIEGPFHFEEDAEVFHDWTTRYNLETYSIVCEIEDGARIRRFKERERHPSHHDQERIKLKEEAGKDWWVYDYRPDYNKMPGQQIIIKTEVKVESLVDKIIKKISNL